MVFQVHSRNQYSPTRLVMKQSTKCHENQNENFAVVADLLVMVYNVDQEQKIIYTMLLLAVNGGDFDRALKYYQAQRHELLGL